MLGITGAATKRKKRSPLKAPPLRTPGQSLEGRLDDVLQDKVQFWLLYAGLFPFLAGLEWARRYFAWPPQPIAWSIGAVPIALIAAWRIRGARNELRCLRLAINGEKAVGQFLESFREMGYNVFHDILADGFNLDQVLIGPGGVFAIETKTISKPAIGPAAITYDGEQVLIDGHSSDRDPVIQAKATASHLRAVLEQSTGKKSLRVRPVVLYPGWYVEKQPKGVDVWVLNPKALKAFLEHERPDLSTEDVSLLAYHLSRHVRESERRRR